MNRKNEQFYKFSLIAKIITIMVTRKRIMNQLLAAYEKFKRIVSVYQHWYYLYCIWW